MPERPPPDEDWAAAINLRTAAMALHAIEVESPQRSADTTLPRIEGYLIERRLGGGGGGAVYLAVRAGSQRPLALKILNYRLGETPHAKRAWRELDVLAQLQLACIPRLIDYGEQDGRLYMAADFVDGHSLEEHCEKEHLDRRERVEVLAKTADAVQTLHEHGVIHRDIKPTNVLVGSQGQPMLIDFGLATLVSRNVMETLTVAGAPIGSPAFMAPEQARGESASTRSDVYSLGATAYVILTRHTPHDMNVTIHEAIRRVAFDHPRDPRALDPTLPRALGLILQKATAVSPHARYASAAEFGKDLRRFINNEPISAGLPGIADGLRRFMHRHAVATAGILGAFLVLVLAVVVLGSLWGYARNALSESQQANYRAADSGRALWGAELERSPPTWADGKTQETADSALASAHDADAAWTAGDMGLAAEQYIAAVREWRRAWSLHEAAVPRLVAEGVRAARADRALEARQMIGHLRELGVEDAAMQTLMAEASLAALTMVPIPTGEFLMGSADGPSENPVHRVVIEHEFLLSATEITQGQFLAVTGRNSSWFKGDLERPVETVSWYDAVEFCNGLTIREGRSPRYKMDVKRRSAQGSIESADVKAIDGDGYRLPTEAEWEYACRAGTTTEFSFGDSYEPEVLDEHMWYGANSDGRTHPVGQKKPNGWRLYDMHGSVGEWCEDVWHDSYVGAPQDGRAWLEGGLAHGRVIRYGTWDRDPMFCRSAGGRDWDPQGDRDLFIGFRVALDGD